MGDDGLRESLIEALRGLGGAFGDEDALQRAIALALDLGRIPYEREKSCGTKGRVDFLVAGHLALEVKIDSSRMAVLRQLAHYANDDSVEELLLVTTKLQHRNMPPQLNGKPVTVHVVMTL